MKPSSSKKNLILALICLGLGSFTAFLIVGPRKVENQLRSEATLINKLVEGKFDSGEHVLTKSEEVTFDPPPPLPSSWKLVYDEDDISDEVVKADVISSINILPRLGGENSEIEHEVLSEGLGAVQSPSAAEDHESEGFGSEDSSIFNPEDLNALAQTGAEVEQHGNFLGGAHVSLEAEESRSTPKTTTSPTPTPTPEAETWYEGQARGYALLYAMHPRARSAVIRQVEIIEKSRVRNVYISILADGTFGQDFAFVESLLRRLTSNGHKVLLGLYLSNGPAMRSSQEREQYGNSINRFDPEEFRKRIQSDSVLRSEFKGILNNVKKVFTFNRQLSSKNSNLAYVMLEDNLDLDSYRAMRSLAAESLTGLVTFVRNPCPGCYTGNDFDPDGNLLELHEPEMIHALRSGDGYSMDGRGLFFPGEFDPVGLSVEDTKTIIAATQLQGISYFALWRSARQGILGDSRVAPNLRIYEVPSINQEYFEIELLRHGLKESTATVE